MSGLQYREVVSRIANGGPVRPAGGGYNVRCPAHDDDGPSLSISQGEKQPVILHCHAGCTQEAVLEAAGLTWDDISAEREEHANPVSSRGEWMPGNKTSVAVYDYTDEHGTILFQVLRSADKDFSQRVPDPSRPSGWRWSLGDTRRVLYRLPAVIEAVKNGQEVWITEGEKDADNLVRRTGVCATTSPMGAGKWRHEYGTFLRDASVTIVADNDDTGREHARLIRASVLDAGAQQARIVESAANKDITDHLDAGLILDDVRVTTPYVEDVKVELAMDLDEYLAQEIGPMQWVVPDVLARGEVILLTGYEGYGKSTWLKQTAVQVCVGVHPFTGENVEPRRVMFLDAENPKRDNIEDFTRLRWIASHHADLAQRAPLFIMEQMNMDITKPETAEWLIERVRAHKPDLLIIGPLYKLVSRELKDEDALRPVINLLDYIKVNYDCAILLEHHVPHGNGEERSVRPIGSSALLRWPNFGFGLLPIVASDGTDTGVSKWIAWRGPRRRSRRWPMAVRHGGKGIEWMWMPADPMDVQQAEETEGRRRR